MRFFPSLLCVFILVSGCATINGPGAGDKGDFLPGVAREDTGRAASPVSLKGRATVEVQKIFSLKGRALIAAQSPDKFRIEVLGPLNSTTALLVGNGSGLYIFSDGKSARYEWEDPTAPFPFRPEEVVSLLLGTRPPGTGDYRFSTDMDGHITKLVKKENGKTVLQADMSDYRLVSGMEIPFSISIKDTEKGMGIMYSSVEVDTGFAPGFFDIDHLP